VYAAVDERIAEAQRHWQYGEFQGYIDRTGSHCEVKELQ
jgi:hypothetical protein